MADSKSASSSGIGFAGMLAILFIGLKLTGHIDWPWLWVLSPLWIGIAFLFAILLIVGVIAALAPPIRRRW